MEFVLVRNIIWWLNGTSAQLTAARQPGAYSGAAHVRRIWFRFCFDIILAPSTEGLFITVHDSFQDPDYVLQDNITLFTIDEKEAIFVESDPHEDAFNSDHGAFLRIAQFNLAKKLIIIPIAAFHQLAGKLPDPASKVIFANNTGRCGSTLVTQAFELTGKALAMNEPDSLNALTRLRRKVSDEEIDRIVVNTIKALCKPISRDINAYVLKAISVTMIGTPILARLYPHAKHIFIYRDGLAVVKSIDKISHAMPIMGAMLFFGMLSESLTKILIRMTGLPGDMVSCRIQCRSQMPTMIWASAMRLYLDFYSDGIPIRAVKYEHLLADPQFAFKQIFDYVGVEFDSAAVTRVLARDSQRGSPLSRAAMSSYKSETITPQVQEVINQACDYFKLPRIPEPFDAPGTITKKKA